MWSVGRSRLQEEVLTILAVAADDCDKAVVVVVAVAVAAAAGTSSVSHGRNCTESL